MSQRSYKTLPCFIRLSTNSLVLTLGFGSSKLLKYSRSGFCDMRRDKRLFRVNIALELTFSLLVKCHHKCRYLCNFRVLMQFPEPTSEICKNLASIINITIFNQIRIRKYLNHKSLHNSRTSRTKRNTKKSNSLDNGSVIQDKNFTSRHNPNSIIELSKCC